MTVRKLEVVIAGDAKGLSDAFNSAADDAKGFGDKLTDFLSGPGLKAGLAGAALALGAVAIDGFMRGMEDEKASDKIAAQLVPGEQDMEVLGRVAASVYAGAWGDSLAEVESAVADLMKAGVEEVDLEPLTQQVLDISTAFDQDFGEVIRTAQQLVNNGLVPDMETAFDVITRGFQNTGSVGRDELLETLNEYSDAFRSLGIDGPTAIGLIDAAIDNGAFNIDKVGDALKEFSIRVVDGSDGTVQALESIGLNAEEMATKIAEGGPAAQEAFSQIVQAIGSMSDPLEQEKAGVALFGSTWEDLGPQVVTALDPAKVAVGDLSQATEDMGKVLNDNLATDVEAFKRVAMQGISDGIYQYALPAIDALRDAWSADGFSGVVDLATESMKTGVKELGTWLKEDGAREIAEFLLVTVPRELAEANIAITKALLGLGVEALKAFGDGIKTGATDYVWPFLKDLPGEAVNAIGDVASYLADKGSDLISGLGDGAETAAVAVFDWFGKLPGEVVDKVGDVASTLLTKGSDLIRGLWDGITGLFGSGGSGGGGGSSTVLGFIAGIPAAVVTAIGDVASTLADKGSQLIGGLLAGAALKTLELAGWVAGLPAQVFAWLGTVTATLATKGAELIGGLIAGAGLKAVELAAWFVGLPAKIVGWLGNVGSALFNAGADLIGGLISGITSKIPGLSTAISSVNSAISGITGAPSVGGGIAEVVKPAIKAGTSSPFGKTARAAGGVVPGRIGELVPILAHGGEEIRPLGSTRQRNGGGQGNVFAPTVNLHGPATLADANRVIEALNDWADVHGPIPISVR